MLKKLNAKELAERQMMMTPFDFAHLVLQNDLMGARLRNEASIMTITVNYQGRQIDLACARAIGAEDISLHRVEVPFMAICLAVCENPNDAYKFYRLYKHQWRPVGSDSSYRTSATSEFRSGTFQYHILCNLLSSDLLTSLERATFESTVHHFCKKTESQMHTLIVEDFFREHMDSLAKIHEECQLQIKEHQSKIADLFFRKRETREMMDCLVNDAPQSIKKELRHTKRFRTN